MTFPRPSFRAPAAALALVLALGAFAPRPAAAYRLDGEPTFDIGLAWDADTLTLAPVESVPLTWREPGNREGFTRTADAVRIRVSGAQAIVEPVGRSRAVPLALLQAGDTLWVGDEGYARGDGRIGWAGKHWRGRFKVFLGPRGRLTLATRVSLERYLLGVVPGEIGGLRDSLAEAGRAQAIAARSYSLFYRGRRANEGFDVYGTVEDQVYGPVESERPLATRCVEQTAGTVCTWDGAPIRANYCSTCGGITADVGEAWPTEDRPYLHSVADHQHDGDNCALSPQYRWREEWGASEFAQTIARWAGSQQVMLPADGIGEVKDVIVDARSHSARVWRLRIVTTTGQVVVPAYSIRQVLRRPGGTSILRSNLFKIGVRRDAAGHVTQVIATGAGSGHGVGLCQTGALAMARGGASAETILEHYYSGTRLTRMY